MSYLVLARKLRPACFGDLIGQEPAAQTLRNAVISGRVAHAFLFTGSRGVGKTSAARILTKALNCLNPDNGDPCNTCENCLEINPMTELTTILLKSVLIRDSNPLIRLYCVFKTDQVHFGLTRSLFKWI